MCFKNYSSALLWLVFVGLVNRYFFLFLLCFLRINKMETARNNGFKLEIFRFRREIGRNWFSNRIVEWNGLSNHIVSSETMGRFKRRLDKYMYEGDR